MDGPIGPFITINGWTIDVTWFVFLVVLPIGYVIWENADPRKQPWRWIGEQPWWHWISDHAWLGVIALLVFGGFLILTGAIYWSPFDLSGR